MLLGNLELQGRHYNAGYVREKYLPLGRKVSVAFLSVSGQPAMWKRFASIRPPIIGKAEE